MTPDACSDYISLLVRAGDGSLAPPDMDRLTRHMESCDGCRAALLTQRLMHRTLAGREGATASVGFTARVLRAVAAEETAPWWDRLDFRRWTWRVAPLTAGLAIAVAAYGVLPATASPRSSATSAAAAVADTTVVSATLLTEEAAPEDVMSLLLFADPDASFTTSLKEIPR